MTAPSAGPRRWPGVLPALAVALLLAACAGGSSAGTAAPRAGRPAPPSSLPFAEGAPAAEADAVVDSIGVNVHLTYVDTPYGRFDRVAAALRGPGIRHVRDGLRLDTPYQVERLRQLAAMGITSHLILGAPHEDLRVLHALLERELLGAVGSVEGPNEHDLSGDPDWAAATRDRQARLHRLVKGDEATAHLPVVAPSLVHRPSRAALGRVDADLGNLHSYTGGDPPTSAHLDSELRLAAAVSGDRPVWVTETGYHNALTGRSDQPPVPEDVAGRYVPRLYLENFRRGIDRTYVYELVDQRTGAPDGEANFGLVRSDFTPKPAHTALGHLIGLYADPGPAFAPGRLDYELRGRDEGTRDLLAQRRDGTFLLAVWQETAAWDTRTRAALDAPAVELVLDVAQPVADPVLHRPSEAGAVERPEPTAEGGWRVAASGSVAVLELRPTAG